jgi:hypothetical protein
MSSTLLPAAFQAARLWLEAGSVIALRGVRLSAGAAEAGRMAAEKQPAFADAALAAALAYNRAILTRPFDPISASNAAGLAWLRAVRRKASANRRRLTRRRARK